MKQADLGLSLTTKRTGSIGIIVSDAANQFFGEMLRGVEEVIKPAGYTLIVCNTDESLDPAPARPVRRSAPRQEVDGDSFTA